MPSGGVVPLLKCFGPDKRRTAAHRPGDTPRVTEESIYDFAVVMVIIGMALAASASAAMALVMKARPLRDIGDRRRWSRRMDQCFRLFLVLATTLVFLVVLGWILDLIFQGVIGLPPTE